MSPAAESPPQPPHRKPIAPALLAAVFVVAYVATDWVTFIHPMQQYGITPWNPQPAFAIALLMVRGQGWLPAVLVASLASEWLVRDVPIVSPAALLVAAVLALGYAAIAAALTRPFAASHALESRRDAVHLLVVVAVGTLATGVLYIAALLAVRSGPLDEPFVALIRFWIGDAVGILVTLPLLLMVSVGRRRAQVLALLRTPETLAHVALVAAALALVFTSPPAEQVKRFYVLFLPLVVIAVRHGLVGATLATLAIQGGVIVAGEMGGYPVLTVFELQSLLLGLTVTGLFLGVTVDERRRAEEELRRTLRLAAAGEMAAALAHELNQPLTAVSNYARASRLVAQQHPGNSTLLLQTLDKLTEESTRAADVVRRLRDFFRTGATSLEDTALDEVARRVAESLREKAQAQQVGIELPAPGSIPRARLDPTQMEVVMRNLLANAMEAAAGAAPPRNVTVTMATSGTALRVEVIDTGPGVGADDAARIFEPFETTRPTGMGMGLAISRAIVEAHGGQLWVEPGARGRFCMTLPLGEAAHG